MADWVRTRMGRRAVMAGLVLAANIAGTLLYNIYATRFIRYQSTSIATDMALRLIYFTFMVVVTFCEGLLVDELLFGGGWRRRVLSGKKPAGDRQRTDGDSAVPESKAAVLFRDYTVHMTLAFLALLAGNYFLFNAVNGDFDSYYRKVGHLITQLRSPDAAQRRNALAELAPKGAHRELVSRTLVEKLEHGSTEERVWAAWGLGYRADWKLLDPKLREEVEKKIIALMAKTDERKRAVLTVALARLESYRWLDEAVDSLGKEDPDPMFAVALGLLRDHRPRSIQALRKLLPRKRSIHAAAASWALGKMQVESAAEPLRDHLLSMDGPTQCVAVEALGRLGDVKSVSLLMRLFESKAADLICPQVTIDLRPDGKGDKYPLFSWESTVYKKLRCTTHSEPLRVRILKVLWRIKDRRILPWIRKVATSILYAPRVKTCAIRIYNMAVPGE